MKYAFEIDAAEILGVRPEATLQEIHNAYRTRVKKHHPDVGGDDWAFRAVARAYELLSHARVHARIDESSRPRPEPAPAPAPAAGWATTTQFNRRAQDRRPREANQGPTHHAGPSLDGDSSRVQAGVVDPVSDPSRLVGVELFTIRFENSGPLGLLQTPEARNLSSCLNIAWPVSPLRDGDPEPSLDPETLGRIVKSFEGIPQKTRAVGSWSRTDGGRFLGWLSYPTANQAFEAFEVFHRALNDRGLGVRQSTRDLFIARERP